MGDEDPKGPASLASAVGLCVGCRFSRKLTNAKGNEFYRCEKARVDDSLTPYPPLPVIDCHAFCAVDPEIGD